MYKRNLSEALVREMYEKSVFTLKKEEALLKELQTALNDTKKVLKEQHGIYVSAKNVMMKTEGISGRTGELLVWSNTCAKEHEEEKLLVREEKKQLESIIKALKNRMDESNFTRM